ncbi:MAG: DUF1820 family protein [Spirochaetota bacterium]|nr:DUF1820 family protein [Spirochaetota bacterium]
MSLYRVHFTWKEKEITLRARSLDLTHPYFVSIKDIILPGKNQLIIDPSEDEIIKTFGEADHFMIPFQKVFLIEELKDEQADRSSRIKPFSLVENDPRDEGDDEDPGV